MYELDSGQVTHIKLLAPNGSKWQVVEQIILRKGKIFLVSIDGSERCLALGEIEIPSDFKPLHEPFACQDGKRCQVSPDGAYVYVRTDSPESDPDPQIVTVAKCLVY